MSSTIEIVRRRLTTKRKECGLTLAQVAKCTSMSISFLSDIENGRGNPSLRVLAGLAECYQTTIAELCIEADVRQQMRHIRRRALEKAREELDAEIAGLVDEEIAV